MGTGISALRLGAALLFVLLPSWAGALVAATARAAALSGTGSSSRPEKTGALRSDGGAAEARLPPPESVGDPGSSTHSKVDPSPLGTLYKPSLLPGPAPLGTVMSIAPMRPASDEKNPPGPTPGGTWTVARGFGCLPCSQGLVTETPELTPSAAET